MKTLVEEPAMINHWLRLRKTLNAKAPIIFMSLLMIGISVILLPNMAHAAASVDQIGTSLSKSEQPIQDLFKKVGSTLFFVVLGLCGLYQFFGNEWTRKAKGMAITGVLGTAIIYNLFPLRDFVTGMFGS